MIFYNILVRPVLCGCNYMLRMSYRRNLWRKVAKVLVILSVGFLVTLYYTNLQNGSLLWYDKMLASLSSETLTIAIVEEHHEVLPYWFAASHKGLLPSHGNILVHVDAHPDTGVLAYDPAISKFKTPETGKQIHLLMQRNDIFITAAAYQDLISTIIWIYPDWVNVSGFGGTEASGIDKLNMKLGFYDIYHDGRLISGFCACYKADEGEGEGECDFTDRTGALLEDFKGQCNTYKVIELYMMKSSMAAAGLPETLETSTLPSSIMLDIDEDFFGVMKGSDSLGDVDFKLIEQFNNLLADTFTILNPADEGLAHSLLENILHMIKATCGSDECSREDFRKIQRFIRETGRERTPIGGRTIKSDELQKVVQFVSSKFSKKNIEHLLQTGFCMPISPLTYKLNVPPEHWRIRYESIAVCHGINVPGMDNQIHLPTTAEIDTVTDTLDSILEVITLDRVKLVTVARSNRDGFTPRSFQQKIEENILLSLQKKFIDSNIVYDRNLMLHLGQGISLVT
ncbi:UPF0489 protein C5orf22 homolog isoform X1 [Watersipora subatra]|uniref:UPF0489 protein C5orf22 homolog isoform X1 n=1 Tax=Watersipora subatra TaxID=2589382 RepID=UPI00355C49EA